MAYQVATKPAPMFSVGTLKIVNAVSAPFAKANVWNKRRQTKTELSRLSSRELADIGLTRGDIENIVAKIQA